MKVQVRQNQRLQDTREINSKTSECSEGKNRGQKVGQINQARKQKGRSLTSTRKE